VAGSLPTGRKNGLRSLASQIQRRLSSTAAGLGCVSKRAKNVESASVLPAVLSNGSFSSFFQFILLCRESSESGRHAQLRGRAAAESRSSLKEQREVEESRAVNPDECFLLPDGLDFKEISSKAGRGARYAYFST